MATKVYVVTQGCYSDYGIERIFSNEPAARAYIGSHSDDEDGWGSRIEVWDLDEAPTANYCKVWICWIALDDHPPSYYSGSAREAGEIYAEETSHKLLPLSTPRFTEVSVKRGVLERATGRKERIGTSSTLMMPVLKKFGEYHEAWVSSSVSAEHCRKLAVEARQAWLRKEALEQFNEGELAQDA